MKRSRLVLGLSALMLAAVGASATTSLHRATIGWYRAADNHITSTEVDANCEPGGTGCLGTSPAALNRQLFTSDDLQVPLQLEQSK
jgi:hypothetical protein